MSEVPPLVDAVGAALALAGALAALVGSLGLVTLRSFLQRVHAPTTASTVGTWSLAVATALHASFREGGFSAHALLVPVCVALTAPLTTVFLMRAAVFRRRATGVSRPPDGAAE